MGFEEWEKRKKALVRTLAATREKMNKGAMVISTLEETDKTILAEIASLDFLMAKAARSI